MAMTLVVETGAGHVKVRGRADRTGSAFGTVVPSSVWVGPDGDIRCADDALEAALSDPQRLLQDWTERLGDPVPFHTEDAVLSSADLLRLVLAEPVAEVVRRLGGDTDEASVDGDVSVAVVVPDGWGSGGVRAVQEAVAAGVRSTLGEVDVQAVPRAEALMEAVAGSGEAGAGEPGSATDGVLVLDIGATAVRAQVLGLDPGQCGPSVRESGLGGELLDERVFRHVLAQIPAQLCAEAGTPESFREMMTVRTASRRAREDLSAQTETDVPVRLSGASSDVRLVRPEVEQLVEADLERILDVGQRAADGWSGEVRRVVLVGGCARMPRLVQLASERWALPVDRPEHPESIVAMGALGLLAVEPARAPEDAPAISRNEPGADGADLDTVAPLTSPSWWRATGAHGNGRSPRRQLLVGAALLAVLGGGAGGAMALLPDMIPAAATQIVTRIETRTVTLGEPAQAFVPWAPGVVPPAEDDAEGDEAKSTAAPGAKDKDKDSDETEQSGQASARVLPGAPVSSGPTAATSPARGSTAQTTTAPRTSPSSPTTSRPTGSTSGSTPTGSGSTSPTSPTSSAPAPTTPTSPPPTTTPPPATTDPAPSTPDPGPPDPTPDPEPGGGGGDGGEAEPGGSSGTGPSAGPEDEPGGAAWAEPSAAAQAELSEAGEAEPSGAAGSVPSLFSHPAAGEGATGAVSSEPTTLEP